MLGEQIQSNLFIKSFRDYLMLSVMLGSRYDDGVNVWNCHSQLHLDLPVHVCSHPKVLCSTQGPLKMDGVTTDDVITPLVKIGVVRLVMMRQDLGELIKLGKEV